MSNTTEETAQPEAQTHSEPVAESPINVGDRPQAAAPVAQSTSAAQQQEEDSGESSPEEDDETIERSLSHEVFR